MADAPPARPVEGDAPVGLLILFVIVILGLSFALLVALNRIEGGAQVYGNPTVMASGPIFELEEIALARHSGNLLGRTVVLENVEVDRVVGDFTFWAGSPPNDVPIVLLGERMARQPELRVEVREGQRVSILGFVRQAQNAEWMRLVTDEEKAEFLAQPVYVSAIHVEVREQAAERR
jgi:hypothetical protein